jgi:tetratricopeptide (TPR) repeat protein
MNAILMRAHAAQQARDAGAALHWFGKAIDLEPQNARLLAMAAAVRLAIGEHEEGAALLERALAPAPDSHDAEDEAGRKKLAQVLTQVYMKYGRGPDDFETIPY